MRLEIFYVLVIIVLIITHNSAVKAYSPESEYFNKGYGNKDDEIDVLLSRIGWANRYKRRIGFFARYLFYSLLIVFMLFVVCLNRVAKPQEYISGVFLCVFILVAFHQYTQHHCEKFGHYAIDRNIKILRKKLGVKQVKDLTASNHKFIGASDCWNFTY